MNSRSRVYFHLLFNQLDLTGSVGPWIDLKTSSNGDWSSRCRRSEASEVLMTSVLFQWTGTWIRPPGKPQKRLAGVCLETDFRNHYLRTRFNMNTLGITLPLKVHVTLARGCKSEILLGPSSPGFSRWRWLRGNSVCHKSAACSKQCQLHKCWNGPVSRTVSEVDLFISHSWSCSSTFKYLAICHLNFDMAALSSLVIAISAVIVLVVRAGSLEGIAQEGAPFLSMVLFQCLMVVFLLAYFAGHRLCSRTLWFDRLCVNQGDIPTKAMTLQAIPAFIAQSKQMLVVWDETFFEQLGTGKKHCWRSPQETWKVHQRSSKYYLVGSPGPSKQT